MAMRMAAIPGGDDGRVASFGRELGREVRDQRGLADTTDDRRGHNDKQRLIRQLHWCRITELPVDGGGCAVYPGEWFGNNTESGVRK